MIKKFNEYIKESSDNSVSILNKISKYINKRFKNENNIILMYWIGLIFGFTKYLFISKIEMSESLKDVKHIYTIIGDKYYDNTGFHSKDEILELFHLSKWSFNDYTFSGDFEMLRNCVKEKDLKLSGKLDNEIKIILQKYKNIINETFN